MNFIGYISRLEYWNIGMLESWKAIGAIIPLFHHSIIPLSNIERL